MRYFSAFSFFLTASLLITSFSGLAQDKKAVDDTNLLKKKVIGKDSTQVKASKAVLDSRVDYHAEDSIRLDAVSRKTYLYGKAVVKYQDLELDAGYIEISMDSNIAYATGVQDSGKTVQEPQFHQGADIFYAKSMRYNFKSRKGKLSQIRTKEGEGYIHGETVKKDSSNVYYIKNGKYTTCGLEADPHFYIAATRLKVIPHEEVVTGPAYMVIEGVPTPLAIPFGFFPLYSGRHSGIIIPSYGESTEQGLFLNDGGYYFGLSDHLDMQVKGSIYTYGSWGLKDIVDYSDRYHYQGNFSFSYADTKLPIPNSSDYSTSKNFLINWIYTQDPKASPNSTFSASVNAGSSKYYSYAPFDPNLSLQNTFLSNIAYTRNFQGTPFHLSVNASQNQNTIGHTIQVILPQVTLTADRMYPAKWFEANPALSTNKWYNQISVGLTTNASNQINTVDSLLFKPGTLKKMQNGINTSIPVSASFHIFRYFTLTPQYNESVINYFQTIRKRWNNKTDSLVTDTVQGLQTVSTYNASATLTTTVYGMYGLGNSLLFRQVMYPSIAFVYHPDYTRASYGYYQWVQYNEAGNRTQYSIFQNGIYGGPGPGESGTIQFTLGNNLEMKVRKHTDTGLVYKKIVLLERFNISTAYNVAADSFAWAPIALSGNTTLFKKLGVNFSGSLDPYEEKRMGEADSNVLYWQHTNMIGRLTSADLSFSTTLTPSQKNKTTATTTNGTTQQQGTQNTSGSGGGSGVQFVSPDQYMYYEALRPQFYAPMQLSGWSLTLYYNILYSQPTGNLPSQNSITQSVTINGSAQITKYWYLSVYTGYDLVGHQFTTSSITARRDLHCWEMSFTAVPFGFHQSFSVDIHVKASVLQSLKLTRKRDWEDTQQYGQ